MKDHYIEIEVPIFWVGFACGIAATILTAAFVVACAFVLAA